jgi:hypothetical protein
MLILGISANFVLDFVHVALKGIIINAEVSSLKISFSYEAPLLLLAPYTPQVTAYAPLSYRFTSLLCCNIFVIRTVAAITAKSKVKSPKNSIPKKESHSLLPAAVPHNTKPKARNNSQPVRRKPISFRPPLAPRSDVAAAAQAPTAAQLGAVALATIRKKFFRNCLHT